MSGINAGELFVNLGLKGAEKTIGALSTVSKEMKGIASASLGAVAALTAAGYAAKRLADSAGARGTSVLNLSNYLGVNTKALQQWEYEMSQAGGTVGEMDEMLKNLQSTLTSTRLGKGTPEGFLTLNKILGESGQGTIDFQKMLDPMYVAEKLRQALAIVKPGTNEDAILNALVQSMGSANFISGSRQGFFTPGRIGANPFESESTLAANKQTTAKWKAVLDKWDRALDQLNAKEGGKIAQDVSKLVDNLIPLVSNLSKVLDAILKSKVFNEFISGAGSATGEISDWLAGKRTFFGEPLDANGQIIGNRTVMGTLFGISGAHTQYEKYHGLSKSDYDLEKLLHGTKSIFDKSYYENTARPNAPSSGAPSTASAPALDVTVNFNTPVNDPIKVKQAVTNGVVAAYRQMNAQSRAV